MSEKISKNSERTSKFENLTISERIQICRDLIYGIKEEKSEKVVINCETIEAEDKLGSKDSRSQKVDECFEDLNVNTTKNLDKEEENEYFGSFGSEINENTTNIKQENEANFEINFDENPPKAPEFRIILKDVKKETNDEPFKNLSSGIIKIGVQVSKSEKNSVNQEFEDHLKIKFASNKNPRQKTQGKVNKITIKYDIVDPKIKRFECHICGKKYLKKHLPAHIRNIHVNSRSFKCEICNVRFNTKLNLNSHQKIHNKNRPKPFKCIKCDYATDLKSSLRRHSETHEMIRRIKRCDKCNTILQKNVIHECRLDCKFCGKKFSHKDNVQNHIKKHHNLETERSIYECDICGLKLYLKNALRTHMVRKHADGKIHLFTCDLDEKKFKTKKAIRKHLAVHLPYVKCDFCDAKLNSEYLKVHIKKVHTGFKRPAKKKVPKTKKNLILKCPNCPKILASKSSLYKHIHVHNKNIKCKFCDKLFGFQSRLSDHIKVYHENQRSFICNICDKTFTRAEYLKYHLKIHDPNRQLDYKCTQCDYATDRNSSLKMHLNFHEKKNAKIAAIQNPHKCPQCPSVFGRKDLLRHHIRAVHPKAKFECDFCGRNTKVKRDMMVHIKNIHKIGS